VWPKKKEEDPRERRIGALIETLIERAAYGLMGRRKPEFYFRAIVGKKEGTNPGILRVEPDQGGEKFRVNQRGARKLGNQTSEEQPREIRLS